jgi:hypothetical protein
MSVGYIYILSNQAMQGLLKIGFTNRDVKERIAQLSSATGVPKPFDIEYYCLTSDVEEIERKAHEGLFSHRAGKKKEFFEVPLVEAINLIDSLVKPVEPDRYCRVTLQQGTQERNSFMQRWLRCRTCNHEWAIPSGASADPPCPKCGWHVADRLRKGRTN